METSGNTGVDKTSCPRCATALFPGGGRQDRTFQHELNPLGAAGNPLLISSLISFLLWFGWGLFYISQGRMNSKGSLSPHPNHWESSHRNGSSQSSIAAGSKWLPSTGSITNPSAHQSSCNCMADLEDILGGLWIWGTSLASMCRRQHQKTSKKDRWPLLRAVSCLMWLLQSPVPHVVACYPSVQLTSPRPSGSPHSCQAMQSMPILASALHKGEGHSQPEPAGLSFVFCW